MKTWLLITLAVIIQEPASTDAAIFQARHLGLNLWIVNLIWLAATLVDIYLGYRIGKWIQKKYAGKKFVVVAEKLASKIENFIGRSGENFALILIGVINFPYLNAFLASWLPIRFRNAFVLILIGDAIYWAIEWGINIGVRTHVSDPHTALYIVIFLGLLFSVLSKTILNRIMRKESAQRP